MKNIFIFYFFTIFCGIFSSQQAVVAHGRFNNKNRVLKLSKEAQRLLFVKTGGNLVVPDAAFFLELTKEDAKIFNNDYIIIIPLNGQGNAYYSTSKEDIALEVIKLTPEEPYVFYTKKNTVAENISYNPEKIENATKKDTLLWSDVNGYEILHNSKLWIDHLDDKREITIQGTRFTAYSDGTCKSSVDFDTRTVGECARQQLHSVANLFYEIDEENWTKEKWQKWFDETINYKETSLTECNPNNWNEKINYRYGYRGTAVYATNPANNQIIRIERTPYQEEYKDQQLMIFDLAKGKNFRYDIDRKETPFKLGVELFTALDNDIFIISNTLNWLQIRYEKTTDQYVQVQKKYIFSDDELKRDYYKPIFQTYNNNDLAYLIVQNKEEDASDAYIVCLDMKTGSVIAKNKMKDVLKDLGIKPKKSVSVTKVNYANADNGDFIFAVRIDEDYFLIKLDKTLNSAKAIQSDENLAYDNFIMTQAGEIIALKNNYGKFTATIYDDKLTRKKSQFTMDMKDDYNDDRSYFFKDGDDIKLFTVYNKPFYTGIKAINFDKNLKWINDQCIYTFLPVEEQNSDNWTDFFYASKNNKNSVTLFFKKGNVLRFANIEDQ